MERAELVRWTADLLRAKGAASFFLNGSPGSGKSYLLAQAAADLAAALPHSQVLGPYAIRGAEVWSLGKRVLEDCLAAGFLDELPPASQMPDLVTAWRWFAEHAAVEEGRTFLTFIDLGEDSTNQPAIGELFSTARHLEGARNPGGPRLLLMIAGYWDHPNLESYYRRISASFPYTVGHNYERWEGISLGDMLALLEQARPAEARPLYGQVLFELTGGHPAAALDVVSRIRPGELGLRTLLSATAGAAREGPAGQDLLRVWCQLPTETRAVVKTLVLQRHGATTAASDQQQRLLAAGLVRRDCLRETYYLSFRSWYVELLVRLNLAALGIADDRTRAIQLEQLIPEMATISVQAYQLIHDIENAVRNFVAVQLCLQQSATAPHILSGRRRRYNNKQELEDAYERALDWQRRSAENGLPADLNPLLAYCSTRDLADLLRDIGIDLRSRQWKQVAEAMAALNHVRDAVMHNQIIDDGALQRLYDLQAEIYAALNEMG